jgi:hypothetical protein
MDTNLISGSSGLLPAVSSGTLFASLFWGSIGVGYWVYAKKQRSVPALIGGIGLVAVSYLIASPVWMSIASVAIMVGIWYWSRYE